MNFETRRRLILLLLANGVTRAKSQILPYSSVQTNAPTTEATILLLHSIILCKKNFSDTVSAQSLFRLNTELVL